MLRGGQVLEKKCSLLTLSEINQNAPVVQASKYQVWTAKQHGKRRVLWRSEHHIEQKSFKKTKSLQQNHVDDDQYCLPNNI